MVNIIFEGNKGQAAVLLECLCMLSCIAPENMNFVRLAALNLLAEKVVTEAFLALSAVDTQVSQGWPAVSPRIDNNMFYSSAPLCADLRPKHSRCGQHKKKIIYSPIMQQNKRSVWCVLYPEALKVLWFYWSVTWNVYQSFFVPLYWSVDWCSGIGQRLMSI